MIKKDLTIAIEYVPAKTGWFRSTEAHYKIGSLGVALTWQQYPAIYQQQQTAPVLLYKTMDNSKCLWMFKGEFYWDNEGHSEEEMNVLLLDKIYQKEKKLIRAKARISQQESAASGARDSIPDDVKMFVWQRDSGRCVKCGGQRNLEFDHIIPLCKGGSNTARNIQLLCEDCNREKGGNL